MLFSFEVVCVERWSFVVVVCCLECSVSCERFLLFCSISVNSLRLQLRYLAIFVKS